MKINKTIILSINLLLIISSYPAPVHTVAQTSPTRGAVNVQRNTTGNRGSVTTHPSSTPAPTTGIKLMSTTAPALNMATATPAQASANNQNAALTQANNAYINPTANSAALAAGTNTYSNAFVSQLYGQVNAVTQRLQTRSQSLENQIKNNDKILSPLMSGIFTYFTPRSSN